jgi:hypothetical protein
MGGIDMRMLCFALLVLVCSMFASMAEAGTGFSVEVYGGGVYVETPPPAVIYTPPPVVYYEQPQVDYERYESYQSQSEGYYEDEYDQRHRKGHHKHQRHHDDEDD